MTQDASTYNIANLIGGKKFQMILDLSNSRYNNVIWREYATWDKLSMTTNFSQLMKDVDIAFMASTIDVDSDKPQIDLSGFDIISGDIPMIGLSSKLTQSDFRNAIQEDLAMGRTAQASGMSANAAMELMEKAETNLLRGIHNKLNFYCLQGISNGVIQVDSSNQPTGTYHYLDFKIPAQNKVKVNKVWSDPTADPIQDLLDKQEYAEDTLMLDLTNFHWEMDKTKYNQLINHPKVIELVKARKGVTVAGYPVTRMEILNVFEDLGIKMIKKVTYKAAVNVDGKPEYVNPFNVNNCVLVPNTPFFDMKRVPSMHKFINTNTALRATVEECITSVSMWDDEHLTNKTDIEAYAFPVPKNNKQILILDTATAA